MRWLIDMRNSDWLLPMVAVIILFSIIFGIAFGLNAIMVNEQITKYNDGVCKACGGHYVYEQAVGHMYGTSYLYRCDGCDAILEMHFLPETK
jgi:hypothetical protein